MLGVTGDKEDHDKTEAWVRDLGVEYTYAYFKDDALSKATDHKGYPHSALINPEGMIVWTGHPNTLTKGLIEQHIKGASKFISFGWPLEFESVAKAVAKRDFGKAISEVDKLVAKGAAEADKVKQGVLALLDVEVGAMAKAMEAGDFLAAFDVADALDGKLKGLPQETAVADILKRLSSDKEAKEILDGQQKLRKIATSELRKDRQIEDAIRRAEQLEKKYEGTIVATQAKDFIVKMRARLKEG